VEWCLPLREVAVEAKNPNIVHILQSPSSFPLAIVPQLPKDGLDGTLRQFCGNCLRQLTLNGKDVNFFPEGRKAGRSGPIDNCLLNVLRLSPIKTCLSGMLLPMEKALELE
jgi:hypothetical protein